MTSTLTKELGLGFNLAFARDRLFLLALAGAPLALLVITWLLPAWSKGIRPGIPLAFSFVLWQPLMEELLFRGLLQGQLRESARARREIAGISLANLATTLLFVLAHFLQHAAPWALAVFLPSLIFGYFRDRYDQVYPAIILHAAYNGFYLAIGMWSATAGFGQ